MIQIGQKQNWYWSTCHTPLLHMRPPLLQKYTQFIFLITLLKMFSESKRFYHITSEMNNINLFVCRVIVTFKKIRYKIIDDGCKILVHEFGLNVFLIYKIVANSGFIFFLIREKRIRTTELCIRKDTDSLCLVLVKPCCYLCSTLINR